MPTTHLAGAGIPDLRRETRTEFNGKASFEIESSRRGLLRGTLTAVLAGAVAPKLFTSYTTATAAVSAGPALSPLELDFSVVEQFRPFDLLPRRFAQVREWFAGAASTHYAGAGLQAEGHPAEVSLTGRALRLRSTSAAPTFFRAGSQPAAPYAAVIVATDTTAQGGGGEAAVVTGLVRDPHNYIVALFDAGSDPTMGTVSIEVAINGKKARVASATADLTGPARFAFVINANDVTALVGDAVSWIPVVRYHIVDLLDLRNPAVLHSYWYGFGASGANAIVDIASLEAGYFGLVGIRDQHIISYSDGTPYIKDDKLYFTASQAGLTFQQAPHLRAWHQSAHWGVWTLDLKDPSRIEHVAKLFFKRNGLIIGDHAGQIVADERDGGFHIGVSGWGDFPFTGIHVHYSRSFEDVLRGVHVIETTLMPLPTDVSSWDPSMVRIGEQWYVGFVESPYQDPVRGYDFHPALARSDVGGQLSQLTRIGADLTRGETEGVILQKIGGRWYLFASDGDDRQYRVYDLSMRLLGFLNAPYGTNIPHPQIVPISENDHTYYLLITFNGTQYQQEVLGYGTHGDFIVMRAAQTVQGHEFIPR